MKITFSSILMAVFWSGILVGIIYKLRKKFYFVKSFGIGCIVLVYLFCVLRMLLPIDFSFTQGIPVRGIFSDVYEVLFMTKYSFEKCSFIIGDVFLGIWLLGFVVLMLQFLYEYRKISRVLFSLPKRTDEQYMTALNKVYERKGKIRNVTILTNEEIVMPIGVGICKWKILLPDCEYTDQELYYILLHEYTHFLNGDLMIKMLTYVFCCIFWWNPIIYFLKKDLDRSMEMKCDLYITEKLTLNETAEYLETIVATLKSSGKRMNFPTLHGAVALANNKEDEIIERFQLVLKNRKNKEKNRKSTVVWAVMVFLVWCVSYWFVPLPSYEAPVEEIEDEPGSVAITPDNSYVIIKNGKYYWVVEGYPDEEITEKEAKELEYDGLEIRE